MNNFNKLCEDIFKPASVEEVRQRKKQSELEYFKEWVEYNLHIKYGDIFNKENINKQNRHRTTALIWASANNYIEIVKLLLDKGADPNIKSKHGNTALIYAVYNNNIDMARLLKQYGARE